MVPFSRDQIARHTEQGAWGTTTLDDIFRANAAATPDRLALIDPPNRTRFTDGSSARYTYLELDRKVAAVAGALRDAGIEQDDVVVVQLPNTTDLVVLYLAVARIGAVISPLPVQYGAHELDFVVGHLRPRLFVTTGNFKGRNLADAARAATEKHECPVVTYRESTGSQLSSLHDGNEGGDVVNKATANDVFTICWTSGTESTPKAVPRTHNNWLAISRGKKAQPGERFLAAFPLVNMGSVGGIFIPWLISGGTLAMHHPFDAQIYLDQIKAEEITYTSAPPTILQRLLDHPDMLEAADLSSLRALGSGAAPIPPHIVAAFRDRFGIEIVNTYASNEGAVLVSGPEDFADPVERVSYFPRLGVPGLNWSTPIADYVETRLVDLETEQDTDRPGKTGELRFRGPTVFPGYFNQPDLTANAFDSLGFYRTGDLFEIAGEGEPAPFYRFVSRVKEVIVRGGMKISPAELESALGACPALQDVAIVGRADREMGERVIAVAVPRTGQNPTLDTVVSFLRAEGFAPYKFPEHLVLCNALPRNPFGKIVRDQARKIAESGNTEADANA
jgi:acyl-CoA synthetase (AMP-forming)/AMP-acid ligase II